MPESAPHREVGRPRVFSDESLFRAVSVVLRRDGYPALTLEAIAREVGCTRQALVRRFGSMRALLLAALDAAAGKISSDYDHARDSWDSPLSALRARYLQPPNTRPELGDDPRAQANTLAYILTTSSDPAFGERFAALSRHSHQEFERFLKAAVAQGELQPVDTTALTRVLHSAWTGETVSWCADQSTDYATMLSRIFEQIIGPYRLGNAT